MVYHSSSFKLGSVAWFFLFIKLRWQFTCDTLDIEETHFVIWGTRHNYAIVKFASIQIDVLGIHHVPSLTCVYTEYIMEAFSLAFVKRVTVCGNTFYCIYYGARYQQTLSLSLDSTARLCKFGSLSRWANSRYCCGRFATNGKKKWVCISNCINNVLIERAGEWKRMV